jgi:hypothetical protein
MSGEKVIIERPNSSLLGRIRRSHLIHAINCLSPQSGIRGLQHPRRSRWCALEHPGEAGIESELAPQKPKLAWTTCRRDHRIPDLCTPTGREGDVIHHEAEIDERVAHEGRYALRPHAGPLVVGREKNEIERIVGAEFAAAELPSRNNGDRGDHRARAPVAADAREMAQADHGAVHESRPVTGRDVRMGAERWSIRASGALALHDQPQARDRHPRHGNGFRIAGERAQDMTQ